MVIDSSKKAGHTLVVCEKPDAAKRIAEALAQEAIQVVSVEGVTAFRFKNGTESFVVCAAQGHIYAISDTIQERSVYPVFDIEWFPNHLVEKDAEYARRRIESIRRLSEGAQKFVNACDYDIEGETIGYNVLRYACAGQQNSALRAKFSTLTKDELVRSFREAKVAANGNLAIAGRTRHAVDFAWGVNLSRALSQALMNTRGRYRTISMGRVQGPTLSYVVDRDVEIGTFVPRPYWAVKGTFDHAGVRVEANYSKDILWNKSEADAVRTECDNRDGVVSRASVETSTDPPPPPFNVGDLQKEAYRVFRFSPSRTLQIAERLYLGALISYPRTGSQKLPPSIGYRKILNGIAKISQYSGDVGELLAGDLTPREGTQADSAHPAIYPTGESPRRQLQSWEAQLLELIIRRFLSVFGKPVLMERANLTISVGDHDFVSIGRRTLKEGWMKYYGKYVKPEDSRLPPLKEGDELKMIAIDYAERLQRHLPRYNQSTLLEKMEREKLGTKATRAEIITTLINRGYLVGESLEATDLGFTVIETMKKHSPSVISTKLTRDTEERLEAIEMGKEDVTRLNRETLEVLSESLMAMKANEVSIGINLDQSVLATLSTQNTLGPCPVCEAGKLIMIRSRTTHKRFVGCTNYRNGCRASAPLPQRGVIKTTSAPCRYCAWPIIYVRTGRMPWRLCVNVSCPGKAGRRNEVQTVQKRR
ncbi:MAG: DNA topoisomerase I [Thaumarchaeota archaeon]|nr:DNA topoisomerase I [Nitrososphaerota archaeon]